MNEIDFQFWEKAFLEGLSFCWATDVTVAKKYADAALAVWREKRREVHMPERDAETIAACRPGHRLVDVDGTWTEVKNAQ